MSNEGEPIQTKVPTEKTLRTVLEVQWQDHTLYAIARLAS